MDMCKSEFAFRKQTKVETPRPPLVPAEKNNAITTTGRPRTREVSSRYRSPTPSGPRRCPSPNLTRTTPASSRLVPKRAQSVDRKRPSTPPSPKSPSTPVRDSSVDMHLTARRTASGRLPDSLWPSTMRSLSVSFQSDTISIPVSKKEKPVSSALSDRTLRSSSNVALKHAETPSVPRKPTPERKRSPLRGKVMPDQSENSRPVDGLHTRLMDQHRWPSRIGGRVSSSALTRSVDLADKKVLRPPSPSRTSMLSSSVTRGVSPSRNRPSTPPSRGVSPSRIRATSTSNQSSSSNSVLSFIADFKKGKKSSSYIEDAHQLRLLYNRHLQWRFANARSETVLYVQKVTAEATLYNVWNATLSLWDSVIRKRINLQQLKLELKLNSVLNDQMADLDDWALLEREHIASLSGAVEDLEASTLRLPVTGGARADIDSLKVAIGSALDVMHAMASSICSLLPRAEGINSLVSELAVVAAREKAMLDECEALLASTAAMQAEECSQRTHLLQIKQALGSLSSQFWQSRHLHSPH